MAVVTMEETNGITCYRCGTKYPKVKGFFTNSYTPMSKGVEHLPICNECVQTMYMSYLAECGNEEVAVRQMCRKMDLYWNKKIYDYAESRSSQRSIIFKYIARLNATYTGKCYDDTLSEEGTLWGFDNQVLNVDMFSDMSPTNEEEEAISISIDENFEVTDEIIDFWGGGNTRSNYWELEQRKKYWITKLNLDANNIDPGTEVLIKQICQLEIDINKARIAGQSTDKMVNTLNTLLGSANLKPNQKKEENLESDIINTPLGVWLYRYEQKRPLPEIDEDCKDVNRIKKYVFTWMGHLCKMMGKKNAYSKLYEDEIQQLRVDMPHYDDDDELTDEEFMMNIMESEEDE